MSLFSRVLRRECQASTWVLPKSICSEVFPNFFLLSTLADVSEEWLERSGSIPADVVTAYWDGIVEEALLLVGADQRETERLFLNGALSAYRGLIPTGDLPPIDIADLNADLKTNGKYFGINPMSFWQSLAMGKHPRARQLAHLVTPRSHHGPCPHHYQRCHTPPPRHRGAAAVSASLERQLELLQCLVAAPTCP